MNEDDKDFLMWIHDRLEHAHGESRDEVYMLKLRQIADNAEIPREEEINDAPESEPAKDHIDMPESVQKARQMLESYHSKNKGLRVENSHLRCTFSSMEREIKALHNEIDALKAALKVIL